MRRLRHQAPGRQLDLAADRPLTELHALGPEVDRLWDLDLGGLSSLAQHDLPRAYARVQELTAGFQGRGYDLVYNLNFSRLSLLLARLTGSPVRGYQPVQGGRDFRREPWLALVYALVHARRFNRVHLSDVFRHLAPEVSHDPRPPALPPKTGEPIIALQLATRHGKRTWPLGAFTRLAALLINRLGGAIWLLGAKSEAPLGKALIDGLSPAQRRRVVNLQGRTDLPELGARLKAAHLLISGDTGTLHLGAALGARTLGLFLGPASCFETGPYGEGHYVLQAEPPCHPCLEALPCPEPFCQAMIPPEAAADLAVSLVFGHEVSLPPLPAGTRLYRSHFDPLGVTYAPLGAGLRFNDLMGLAYRRAGAELLGLDWPAAQPAPVALNNEDWRDLEGLAAALRNGGTSCIASPALTPLWAYYEEIRRQRPQGRDEAKAQASFAAVKQGLRAGLEELQAAGR
jgi:ADP-heptose:LPS heptosyltransferase